MRIAKGKTVRSLGLTCVIVASLLLAMPLAAAPPGGGGGPPANPAIAYYTIGSQNRHLKVMNEDGSNAVSVFQGYVWSPTWSPDGVSLAFDYVDGVWAIDVVVVDGTPRGSNLRVLVASCDNGNLLCQPAWSPSGTEIAFVGGYNNQYLMVVPSTGGTPTTLFHNCGGYAVVQPTWRADASRLAFVGRTGANCDVVGFQVLVRATGEIETTIPLSSLPPSTGTVFASYGLDWARTQDTLAFVSWPPGTKPTVHTIDLATAQVTLVTPGIYPTWSPDDGRIAFSTYGESKSQSGVKVINLATGTITKLTGNGESPDWSR